VYKRQLLVFLVLLVLVVGLLLGLMNLLAPLTVIILQEQ
jgi:hypothetical protein